MTLTNPASMSFTIRMSNREEAVTSVEAIIVSAGTDPSTIDPSNATPLAPQQGEWSQYSIAMPMNQDVNLYVFVNEYLPVTDGRVHRAWVEVRTPSLSSVTSRVFPGLAPHFDYAILNGRVSSVSLEYIIFSHVPGQTRIRVTKPDGTGEILNQPATAGINEFNISANMSGRTGTYLLSLSKDGGSSWQRLCNIRLFKGEDPWGMPIRHMPQSRLSFLDTDDTSDRLKINEKSELQAAVMVEDEDFEQPVILTLTNTLSGTTSSINGFDENASVLRNFSLSNIAATYDFTMPLADLADGLYMASFIRGDQRMDYLKFEKFNGEYLLLNVDELTIRPTVMEFGEGQYIRIWLSDEKVHIGNINSGFFSVNGGDRWEAMNRFDANNIPRWLDRGLTLWFSDIDPKDANAKFIKFPTIAKRDRAPRIEVNYVLAHMVNDELVYDGWENLWVAVERGTSTPLGVEWSYLYGDNSGKPDRELGSFRMNAAGIPIPECDEREANSITGVAHRNIRINYFVYRAPYVENGAFHPATKPVRLRVSCYGAPRAVRVNYKTEMMKVRSGIMFHEGIQELITTTKDISITELIDNGGAIDLTDSNWFLGMGYAFAELEYSVAPTARRPASGIVLHTLAERRECSDEETLSERELKPSILNSTGRLRPAKGIEFRTVGTEKWGSFKQPANGDAQIEFRFKANARGGRLFYEGDMLWVVNDDFILRRFEGDFEELERFASGVTTPFLYEWGTLENGKMGITRIISDIDICCETGCVGRCW
jgi:hypothetical protein